MKNLRRIYIVIFTIILSMSCVVSAHAFDQHDGVSTKVEAGFITHEALSGDSPVTVRATTQCPSCRHSSYTLCCGGSFNNPGVYADPVDCSISSHNSSSQCRIWDRLQYKTNGYCTHELCSQYNLQTNVGQHTESCRHTNYNDNNLIPTCYY